MNVLDFMLHYSVPFDWKTPEGYFVISCIQIGGLYVGTAIWAIGLCFFASFCKISTAFADDIKESLYDLGSKIKSLQKRKKIMTKCMLKRKLCDIMQFQTESKR